MSATSIREGPPQEEGVDGTELARRAHMRALREEKKAEKKRQAEAKKEEELAVALAAASGGGDESDKGEGGDSKAKKKTKRGRRRKGKGGGTQSNPPGARDGDLRSERLMPLLTLDEIEQHERYRNGPCSHFSRSGACNYIDTTCRFTHLEVDREPCLDYFSGRCRYNPCFRSHNEMHRPFVASATHPRRGQDVDRRATQLAGIFAYLMPLDAH
jgi:hypothetical protein